MLKEVKNPNYIPTLCASTTVPRAFVEVSGVSTQPKLMLANAMIVDWQIDLKKVKIEKKR